MKHPSIPQPVDYFQLNLAPSGVAGLNPGFLVMPGYGVLLGFFYLEFSPGRLPYYAASFIILLIISSLATWIFLHPQQRMEALSKMGWTLVDITNSTLLKQALLYNLFWTVFVFYAQVLPDFMRYEFDLDLLSGGLSFIGGLTISLDIIDEASYYLKTGAKASVKAAEFHDVYEAQMVKTCLEANGIQCYLRGYNYRKMLYLFGPFIEMSLMVPSGAKDRAKELISEFYTLTGR